MLVLLKDNAIATITAGTHCYEHIAERSGGNAKPPEGVLNVLNCG